MFTTLSTVTPSAAESSAVLLAERVLEAASPLAMLGTETSAETTMLAALTRRVTSAEETPSNCAARAVLKASWSKEATSPAMVKLAVRTSS